MANKNRRTLGQLLVDGGIRGTFFIGREMNIHDLGEEPHYCEYYYPKIYKVIRIYSKEIEHPVLNRRSCWEPLRYIINEIFVATIDLDKNEHTPHLLDILEDIEVSSGEAEVLKDLLFKKHQRVYEAVSALCRKSWKAIPLQEKGIATIDTIRGRVSIKNYRIARKR
jgi:hypothetical protein